MLPMYLRYRTACHARYGETITKNATMSTLYSAYIGESVTWIDPRASRSLESRFMAIKAGINGFGRIGRNIMRAALGSTDIDFVAVNDLTNAATLAHLLKYDSILGNLKSDISASGDRISVDGDTFQVLSIKDPA